MHTKVLRSIGKVFWLVVLCTGLSSADSIELRNGRRLQGKYVGGSTTVIGFMTSSGVEYFATTDVLALIFDNSSEAPLGGLQPNHMKSGAAPEFTPGTVRQMSDSEQRGKRGTKRKSTTKRPVLVAVKD